MTLFANKIGLSFLAWTTLVLLAIVSLAVFLTIALCFRLCAYNKLELAVVAITRFSLALELSFLINHFSFDAYRFNILVNSMLFNIFEFS